MELNRYFINTPIAHRGLHDKSIPENSMTAFSKAIANGYAIELDVRLTKDGELVVFHDNDLLRVCGRSGIIKRMTLSEVQAIPLPNGEIIPTLKTVLDFIDGAVPVLIEVKVHGWTKTLPKTVLSLLRGYKHKDKIALQSFDPRAVRYLKNNCADFAVGQLSERRLKLIRPLQYALGSLLIVKLLSKADFISYKVDDLPNKYVENYKRKGLKVLAWTVKTAHQREIADKYADNIIFEI